MDSDDSQKELERRYLKDKLKVNIIQIIIQINIFFI